MKKCIFVFTNISVFLMMCGFAHASISNQCSEETGPCECPYWDGAHEVHCYGGWCDDLKLVCDNQGFTVLGAQWTDYTYSGEMHCPPGYFVTQMDCDGGWCSGVALNCVFVALTATDCAWTDWFSEEDPNYGECPDHDYIEGIECSGARCDNMRLNCCDYGL